jgi:hypothetical protein
MLPDGLLQQDIDYSCNQYLKEHSNKNGLVTVKTHFPNPVFTDLLKPDTQTGKRWRSYLDIVAESGDNK